MLSLLQQKALSMKKSIVVLILSIIIFSCKEKTTKTPSNTQTETQKNDTLRIGSITDEDKYISNQKITHYFPILEKDTLKLYVELEHKDNIGYVDIHFQKNMTYDEQYNLLKPIFKKINTDFPLVQVDAIFLGLISTGDLAITVTKQLEEKTDDLATQVNDYNFITDLLLETQLSSDLNTLLNPCGVEIKNIQVEKMFLMDKKYLKDYTLKTPTKEIPNTILDAITWITLKKS